MIYRQNFEIIFLQSIQQRLKRTRSSTHVDTGDRPAIRWVVWKGGGPTMVRLKLGHFYFHHFTFTKIELFTLSVRYARPSKLLFAWAVLGTCPRLKLSRFESPTADNKLESDKSKRCDWKRMPSD